MIKISRSLVDIRLLLWFIISFSFVGRVFAALPTDRDSLYRHISHEMSAEISCLFTYEQGSGVVDSTLGGNALELSRLDTFIVQALSYSPLYISRIRLTGYSSVEGDYSHNESLARERVEEFYTYLRGSYPELYRYPHNLAWVAEDWVGLAQLVKESHLGERDEVLEIIRKVRSYDEREALLIRLNGGHAYDVMGRTMFPRLRRVELQIEYQFAPRTEPVTSDPLIYNVLEKTTPDFSKGTVVEEREDPTALQTETQPHPTTLQPHPDPLQRRGRRSRAASNRAAVTPSSLSFGEGRGEAVRPLFAIKTNALQWAGIQPDFTHTTPVANVALEYFVTPHWSVELSAMYSYWRYNHNKAFQGISGYKLGPRYHLSFIGGKFGVYLGCYGRVGDYDMWKRQNDEDLQSENQTGDYWDAGLSAGFTVGLAGGWALEAGASVGYLRTSAIRYVPDGLYNWFVSRHSYDKVKVTDLNVSLVYRFK